MLGTPVITAAAVIISGYSALDNLCSLCLTELSSDFAYKKLCNNFDRTKTYFVDTMEVLGLNQEIDMLEL